MTTPQEGTAAEPQVTPQASAEPQQLSQATPEPAAQPAPAATQPDPAALQAELAQEREARQLAERQARDHQAAFTQARQQLAAAMGVLPQQDPLKPYQDKILADFPDLDERAAKLMAKQNYESDQRFSALQGALNAQGQIPSVMQQVYAQAPQLFANQSVATEIENALRQAAAQGQAHLVNPQYAMDVGAIASFRASLVKPTTAQQTLPSSPQFPSQFGPISGYTAPARTTPAGPSADTLARQQAAKAEVAKHFNFKPAQP